jgi:hypothetical protein
VHSDRSFEGALLCRGDFWSERVHFDEVTAHLNREDSELLQVIVKLLILDRALPNRRRSCGYWLKLLAIEEDASVCLRYHRAANVRDLEEDKPKGGVVGITAEFYDGEPEIGEQVGLPPLQPNTLLGVSLSFVCEVQSDGSEHDSEKDQYED